jgi:hypothetical protein
MAQAFTSRHWSLVAIELVLIVAGILAALSIDDWAQERENRRTEQVYLGLLSRDLEQMSESLQAYIDTETAMAEASATVLRKLSVDNYQVESEALRGYLSDMGTRRTLQLVSPTYTDLTSTGNFRLIHSPSLRDQLLRYFVDVSRVQLVVEKNNAVFIDDMYWSFTIDAGITWAPTSWKDMGAVLRKSEENFHQFLGPDIPYPDDALFAQPLEAEIWNRVRRMCFLRLRVSSTGLSLTTQLMEQTNQLKLTIDQALRDME